MQQPWSGWAILLTINVVVFILQVIVDPAVWMADSANRLWDSGSRWTR